jgi:hypothetical protein
MPSAGGVLTPPAGDVGGPASRTICSALAPVGASLAEAT